MEGDALLVEQSSEAQSADRPFYMRLYAEGGTFDFQWKVTTVIGRLLPWSCGVTYGYARQLARHLWLEFNGHRVSTTEYKKYTP